MLFSHWFYPPKTTHCLPGLLLMLSCLKAEALESFSQSLYGPAGIFFFFLHSFVLSFVWFLLTRWELLVLWGKVTDQSGSYIPLEVICPFLYLIIYHSSHFYYLIDWLQIFRQYLFIYSLILVLEHHWLSQGLFLIPRVRFIKIN